MTAIHNMKFNFSHCISSSTNYHSDCSSDDNETEQDRQHVELSYAYDNLMKNPDDYAWLSVISDTSDEEVLCFIRKSLSDASKFPTPSVLKHFMNQLKPNSYEEAVKMVLSAVVQYNRLIHNMLPNFIRIIRFDKIRWTIVERVVRLYVRWLSVTKITNDSDERFVELNSFTGYIWSLDVSTECKRHLLHSIVMSLMALRYINNILYATLLSRAPPVLISEVLETFIVAMNEKKLIVLFNNLLVLFLLSEQTMSKVVEDFIQLSFLHKKVCLLNGMTELCFKILVSERMPSSTEACAKVLLKISTMSKSSGLNIKWSIALPDMKPFLEKVNSGLSIALLLVFLYEWRDLFPPVIRCLKDYSSKRYSPAKRKCLNYPVPRDDRIGLSNPRNLCYMNSVIQTLFTCNRFRSKILHSKIDDSKQMTVSLRRCFAYMTYSEKQVLDVSCLLKKTLPVWFSSEQQDASEYFSYLVDGIGEECPDLLNLHNVNDDSDLPINKMFGGKFLLKTTCLECNNVSESFDVFTIIYLTTSNQTESKTAGGNDFTNGSVVYSQAFANANSNSRALPISQLLENVYTSERLTGTNLYECKTCNKKVEALKESVLVNCPFYIPLVVNSYDLSTSGFYFSKARIKITLEKTISLKCQTHSKKFVDVTFNLISVIVHAGLYVKSGHYYCYAKAENGNWWCLNDDHSKIVTFEEMCEQIEGAHVFTSPYLLIYGRSNDLNGHDFEFEELNNMIQTDIISDNEQFRKNKRGSPIRNGSIYQCKNANTETACCC